VVGGRVQERRGDELLVAERSQHRAEDGGQDKNGLDPEPEQELLVAEGEVQELQPAATGIAGTGRARDGGTDCSYGRRALSLAQALPSFSRRWGRAHACAPCMLRRVLGSII